MDEAFIAKYTAKIAENVKIASNMECLLWTGTPGKTYGSICCKVGSTWKTFYVHRLALMMHNKAFGLPQGLDVSHLCHNERCTNIQHFSLEPHYINNNRQNCLSEKSCTGHGIYPDCMLHLSI